jgi:PAS domain-containing protein
VNERQGISIAVLSSDQDDVELVNRSLRDAGHIAHCRWISKPAQFDEALRGTALELIILNCDTYPDSIRQTAKQKDAFFPEVPLIALRQEVDEAGILQAMKQGACDLVSLRKMDRLQAVVSRELRAFRVERALNSTLSSATEYRRQLQAYMQGSRTAIANVQEGIVTDVNSAWLKLFRLHSPDEVVGLPLMDLFEAESQAAIKGALIATVKGKWQAEEKLLAKSQATGDDKTELQLGFGLIEMDDGQYVQIRIAPPEKAAEEPTKLVHEALKRDPTTLLFHRAQFLERLK